MSPHRRTGDSISTMVAPSLEGHPARPSAMLSSRWPFGDGKVMKVPADPSVQAVAQPIPPGTVRRARRRRPTGEPPPLPHHVQTSGVGWLIAALVLVALTIVVFAGGLRGVAVDVTVADDAAVSR